MKCPHCGQWNRASLPRCIRCGTEFDSGAPVEPSWRSELKDEHLSKEYMRVDEDGDINVTPDDREVLAAEMAELKARKEEGTRRQRRLRQESARRGAAPTSMTYRTQTTQHDTFFDIVDDPATTVRIQPRGAVQETEAPVEEPAAEEAQEAAEVVFTPVRNPRGTRVVQNPGQWQDSRTYDPIVDDMQQYNVFKQPPSISELPPTRSRRKGLGRIIRMLTAILMLGVTGLCIFFGVSYFRMKAQETADQNRASVTASIVDDLAAHTILIPGEDGQQIYIRELHDSYEVVGGFATIEIPDYTWYEELENITESSMSVTLTPYLKTTSGRQKPLDLITYDITIPLSPIELVTPEQSRIEVTTAMYSMLFNVRPESTVYINGKNVSDTVNENGELTYNATVQPIGDNVFNVSVRSPYCRENSMQVVLYREVQEIPLDLAATTYTSTSLSELKITATTLPGAEIEILSPHSDLNITTLDTTGEFSFYAVFDKIGYNTISLTASFPGKKTSQVDYQIYYLPSADVYTPKAWPLNSDAEYAELLSNIAVRAERTQIYVAVGTIDHFVSDKPQMAVIYCSDDGKSRPVLLENQTKTTWKEGEYYSIYCDAYGTYNGMPWLIARYTYQ
ncbi:MAG: hypothetical protein IJ438_03375 [Clostridia bacterium]|nr:hypothetical protein [Clostridia bacterium]